MAGSGGNGIDAAIARLMAARGRRPAIIDRDIDAADLHARAFHGDVADDAAMRSWTIPGGVRPAPSA